MGCRNLGGLQCRWAAPLGMRRGQRKEALHVERDTDGAHGRPHRRRPQRLQQPIVAPACQTAKTNALISAVAIHYHLRKTILSESEQRLGKLQGCFAVRRGWTPTHSKQGGCASAWLNQMHLQHHAHSFRNYDIRPHSLPSHSARSAEPSVHAVLGYIWVQRSSRTGDIQRQRERAWKTTPE